MNENDNAPDFENELDPSELGERRFINGDRAVIHTPERHGFVTIWLIFMLVSNSFTALIYFLAANEFLHVPKISVTTLYLLTILCVFNIIFCLKLLRWKKSGFYGTCITTILAFLINIANGISYFLAILGLAGLGLLYGILQIKKGGVSAWNYMK